MMKQTIANMKERTKEKMAPNKVLKKVTSLIENAMLCHNHLIFISHTLIISKKLVPSYCSFFCASLTLSGVGQLG